MVNGRSSHRTNSANDDAIHFQVEHVTILPCTLFAVAKGSATGHVIKFRYEVILRDIMQVTTMHFAEVLRHYVNVLLSSTTIFTKNN